MKPNSSRFVKSGRWNREKSSCHDVPIVGFEISSQCISQRDASSSRYGSHPPSSIKRRPISEGRRCLLFGAFASGSNSINWVTLHQCRILDTIFLPTPSRTRASSSKNSVGHSWTPRTPFSSHQYLNANVWCPANLYLKTPTIVCSGPQPASFVTRFAGVPCDGMN